MVSVSLTGRQAAALDPASWLAAIIEDSDDAILSKTLDGIITTWNSGASRLFGYTAEEAIGRPVTIVIPRDRLHEEDAILARLRVGERIDHFETVRQRKNGELIHVSLTVSPVRDATGRIIGASKIARDITARKQAQEQQILLLREMRHRIKNLFALAAGLVRLSARNARTIDDLTRNFTARLMALSHAHELALPDPDQGDLDRSTPLKALLKTIVAAHDTRDGPSRISIEGPDIALQGQALTSLALVLHELTTNAAKYGALACPDGKLSIMIHSTDEELILHWRESEITLSGEKPAHQGFGTSLEQVTLRGLGGMIDRTWTPGGLIVELRLPGDRLAH